MGIPSILLCSNLPVYVCWYEMDGRNDVAITNAMTAMTQALYQENGAMKGH